MSFLGEFKLSFNDADSSMTLVPLGADGKEKLYGGYPRSWWQRKFRYYSGNIKNLKRMRDEIKSGYEARRDSSYEKDTRYVKYDRALNFYSKLFRKLERKASYAGIPKSWRVYP